MPRSSPATCSVECLKGRCVSRAWQPCTESAPTIPARYCRVVCRSAAPLPLQSGRPSLPTPPPSRTHSPSSTLLPWAPCHGHGRHCRRAKLELPLLLAPGCNCAAMPLLAEPGPGTSTALLRSQPTKLQSSPRLLSSPAPRLHVAGAPCSTSGRAEATGECARPCSCSAAAPPSPTSPLRPSPTSHSASSAS